MIIIMNILGGPKKQENTPLQSSEGRKPVSRKGFVIQLIEFSDGSKAVIPANPDELPLHEIIGMIETARHLIKKALD